jgi:hypothetical protein
MVMAVMRVVVLLSGDENVSTTRTTSWWKRRFVRFISVGGTFGMGHEPKDTGRKKSCARKVLADEAAQ